MNNHCYPITSSFVPPPPIFDLGELKQDVDRFFRSASLYLWHLKDNDTQTNTDESDTNSTNSDSDSDPHPTIAPFQHPKLKPKSMWTPPFPSLLEHVYQLVLHDIFEYKTKHTTTRNLSSGEYKAINSLKNNRKIVIKPADKGSNVVILNRKDYVQEGLRQLGKGEVYEKQDKDLTEEHFLKVKEVVEKMVDTKEINKKNRWIFTSKL